MVEWVQAGKEPRSQACGSHGATVTLRSCPTAPVRGNLKTLWKGACVMATARWNGVVLAESDHCRIVEGNYYFPPESVHREYLKPSHARSLCFWKGLASYYHLEVDGARNHDAACDYPAPSWFARRIKNYVAFWNGVEVEP